MTPLTMTHKTRELKIHVKSSLLILLLICSLHHPLAQIPIIPGGKGHGITTVAGSGRHLSKPATTVIRVTNLNRTGEGSLTAALEASGPRIVVFEVSGTIHVTENLVINNPYITIAGQTAPSPGITIRGAALTISTHDVLVQHLRIRVGDDPDGPLSTNRDGLQISSRSNPVYNVVIDHCSVSWGVDENIQLWYPNRDITVMNTISSEGLHISIHVDEGSTGKTDPHSMGFIAGPGAENISVICNLFVHNRERNPFFQDKTSCEVLNNLIYNASSRAIDTRGTANVIGNHIKTGPDAGKYQRYEPIRISGDKSIVYTSDNIGPQNMVQGTAASPLPLGSDYVAFPAVDVYEHVLVNAGARPADRDAVDTRIINDVRNGTGRLIDSQNEVGGWPVLAENRRTLILPDNPDLDDDNDGYTNLEEWLHEFAAKVEGR